MYKLVIVDDDEWIREGMRRNIPWEQEKIQVVGVAEDGKMAWDLIQKVKPDILLSDIQMPFMNGLQLAETIKDHGLDTKVIFLTGYDDFSFAKQALQLQASDYILKYEDNNKILQSVVNAANRLHTERKVVLKEKKSQGLIINQFFSDLIAGVGNDDTIERDSQLLEVSFCGNTFAMGSIDMGSVTRYLKPNKPEDMELLLFSMKNLCTEVIESEEVENCQVQVIQYNHRINLLFNFTEAISDDWRLVVERVSRTMIESINLYLKITVNIGIGSFGEGFRHIALSYEEALIALQMKGIFATQDVIFTDQVKQSNSSHHAIIKIITDYIDVHYANEDLDLKEVAEKVHITPSYVSTLFKKYNDVNFSDYVIRVRMKKAKELLIHSTLKAYEIAECVGYPNTQYFSVTFKKYTGLTPMEYRQNHRQ